MVPYDHEEYLAHNSDIEQIVKEKKLLSAFEHYLLYGYHEILKGERTIVPIVESSVSLEDEYVIPQVLRKKIYQHFIKDLDKIEYLQKNSDLILAIENRSIENIDVHFLDVGMEEIYQGTRVLMKGLDPYIETLYCELNQDIKAHFSEEGFISGFEHFLLYGYKEVLDGLREMKPKDQTETEKLDTLSLNRMLIEQSGYFDQVFYTSNYPDIDQNIIDPLSHYIMHGADELRDPNETFSTSYYLGQYPEVLKSGINPLVHYILVGEGEKRKTIGKDVGAGNMEFFSLPLVATPSENIDLKIAVVIHAFYIDVLEDIITSIDHISPRPDLFISVSEDADVKEIEDFLTKRGYPNFVIIPVQNRGRDVAPFLTEFAELLKDLMMYAVRYMVKNLFTEEANRQTGETISIITYWEAKRSSMTFSVLLLKMKSLVYSSLTITV